MMKLLWSSRSPYVRKVMVVAHEAGLAGRIELERMVVAASGTNALVMQHNPLNKIPTLMLETGATLFDSRVICEYLDGMGSGPSLFPLGAARWVALRHLALGDGLMDLLLARIGENTRPVEIRSGPHQAAFASKIAAVLDRLEQETALLAAAPLSIGGISVGCALAHLDFRKGEDWRAGRPGLTAWHAALSLRPSMQATAYSDEY